MEDNPHSRKQLRQKKYRKKQSVKGLARLELQVDEKTKTLFHDMVDAVAQHYDTPWDPRRRSARARREVFENALSNTKQDFLALKDEVACLQKEIAALSSQFFKKRLDSTPLPMAIQTLQADVPKLKQMIAGLLQENQKLTKECHSWKENAIRNEKLCEALSDYNDTLKAKLDKFGIPADVT